MSKHFGTIALVVAFVAHCGGGGSAGGPTPPSGPPPPPASQTVFAYSSPLGDFAIHLPPGITTYRACTSWVLRTAGTHG